MATPTRPPNDGERDLSDRPIGELLREFTEQTTTLIQKEIELAKAEMTEKVKRAGTGAGMFGGAGLFGLLMAGCLTTAAIAALATGMDVWLAALIVAVVYGLVTAVLALRGRNEMRNAAPVVPEQAIESSKEDVRWAKNQAQSSRK